MIPGKRWLGLAMAGAVGLPIAFSSEHGIGTWFDQHGTLPIATSSLLDGGPPPPPGSEAEVHAREVKQAVSGRIDTPPIPEVFRFDATLGWVLSRWSRVTTGLSTPEMQSYRVALVTGTRETDVAGALTYYFDAQQRLRRLTFQGTTGNPAELVAWLTSRHGFKRKIADKPRLQLYQVKRFAKVTSELQISPASVVRADSPHARFEIALDMNNPD